MFEGFKSRYVKVKKGKVFCKIKGDGPPLLLLHGYPQTHLMWHKTAPELSKYFPLFNFDVFALKSFKHLFILIYIFIIQSVILKMFKYKVNKLNY